LPYKIQCLEEYPRMTSEKAARHVLSLSGGKDSTALALYMRDKVPDMEYIFCDTGKELPETYEYINKIEALLGKPIVRLNSEYSFDHWLQIYSGFLP
jgi:3'-phosphoadenosine 5'-phosphosulfate sulfotransferase (PAPS reductase)/FAD synthetase